MNRIESTESSLAQQYSQCCQLDRFGPIDIDHLPSHVIRTKNYVGELVVFPSDWFLIKLQKHPELKNRSFLACANHALVYPDEVWADDDVPETRTCYYLKLEAPDDLYAKVVVTTERGDARVLTAFLTDHVKEKQFIYSRWLQ